MRALVSNIVTEDYVIYAELGGVDRRRILHLLRHAQRPGAAGDRARAVARRSSSTAPSSPRSSSAIPASATCSFGAVYAGDYSLVIGIASVSIIAVAFAALRDRPRLPAARSAGERRPEAMLKIVRDLFRYNREFALGAILILLRRRHVALASFFSPYPPSCNYVVPLDVPPSWALSVRHQLARSGCLLAAHLRDPQHASSSACRSRCSAASSRSSSA